MGFRLPNGATLQIASTYGPAIPVTALSNANPAVASAAAHGLTDGDIIAVTSGWTRLNDRAARVANSLTGTFALENVNTTNLQPEPAGYGWRLVVLMFCRAKVPVRLLATRAARSFRRVQPEVTAMMSPSLRPWAAEVATAGLALLSAVTGIAGP